MKIIFICGSLEPGKDGVGDYTRRLCSELLKQGVSVGMLAYNDKHIPDKMEGFQEFEGYDIPCLRLPRPWKVKARTKAAKDWIASHNPDWLSLQFVPYAFNDRGLPIKTGRLLKDLAGNISWHVMVHELWIGMSYQSSIKEKCIGQVQKAIVKQLLSTLAPKVIHTQTELYRQHLQNLGFAASILPLFSNIPNVEPDCNTHESLKELHLPNNYLVVFGSIHKNAPIKEFVKELDEVDPDRAFSFVALGRNGGELDYWTALFEQYGFNTIVLGEQSVQDISYVLRHATFGLATTPYDLIEKSGSVAAMHEHNLPVICFSKPWNPINFNREDRLKGVFEYKFGNLKACMDNDMKVQADEIQISNVTKSFLKAIKI